MDFSRFLGPFADAVLSRDPGQRVRLSMCLNTGIYYISYSILLVIQIHLGFAPPLATGLLVGAELAVAGGVYAFMRGGWNLRFADPSLTLFQLGLGLVFTMWAFAVLGPGSSAILMIVASQLVYTMFSLPPRQVNRFVVATLLGLGLTMAACHHHSPERYPADVEMMAFLYACLVFPLIGSLATRVTSMSEKLRANRRQLEDALAKVNDLATRDDLTRTYNRRHMTELMRQEQQRHRRNGAPLTLALLDIDLFKSVNDRYGHAAGDEVLKRFASVAGETKRAGDMLSRWGGEEFMLLFTETPADDALVALRRLQQALDTTSFDDIAPGLRITFSGGVTRLDPQEPLDAAVERADQAMYQAKTSGRARSLLAGAQASALEAPSALSTPPAPPAPARVSETAAG